MSDRHGSRARLAARRTAEVPDSNHEAEVKSLTGFDRFPGSTVPELLAWVQAIPRRVFAEQAGRLPRASATNVGGIAPPQHPAGSRRLGATDQKDAHPLPGRPGRRSND